jgi:hypothetical protein
MQWMPQSPFSAPLSNATYSCDSQLVYAGFVDGSVGVFDAESLRPRCRLAPNVHIPQGVSGYVHNSDLSSFACSRHLGACCRLLWSMNRRNNLADVVYLIHVRVLSMLYTEYL